MELFNIRNDRIRVNRSVTDKNSIETKRLNKKLKMVTFSYLFRDGKQILTDITLEL
jgi:hypothetical protein